MTLSVQHQKIAITGIGVFSPIGIGREEFWKNLALGQSAVGVTHHSHCTSTPHGIGAEVSAFDEDVAKKDYLKAQRKSIKMMSRETQLGTAAAVQALADSRLNLDEINHQRMGVLFGANLMFFPPHTMVEPAVACRDGDGKFQFGDWGDKGMSKMEPLWMLRYLPNMPACHIAINTDARGPNNSVTLDEASPGVALSEAINIIRRGAADVMFVGATGTRINPVRALHARMAEPLGYDEKNPEKSCKPFDQNRNGQVVSEGAACLILETEEHAKNRGATIHGYLLGGSSSCVANHLGEADIATAVHNACRNALKNAGVDISEIGHINAHGLGSLEADRAEAEGIRRLLGDHKIPVTAMKGFFGNAGAATGLIEIVGSLESLNQSQSVPPILNCDNPDSEAGLDFVVGAPRPTDKKLFLNISFTRLGQASVVVVASA